jgi:hypothetical protein
MLIDNSILQEGFFGEFFNDIKIKEAPFSLVNGMACRQISYGDTWAL